VRPKKLASELMMRDSVRPAAAKRRLALVTGGAGFIGSHLVDALIESDVAVRVVDNFATGRRENLNPAAEFVRADIRESDSLPACFAGADCVFHLAALPRVPLSIEQPIETHLTNALGTLNVLVAARKARVRRVIYASSSSVYGEQQGLPLREEMTPNPLSPYALQKLAGEQYMRLFHRLFGLETVVLRYFNVFGPRMSASGPYATVISAFLCARREERPLPIYGDGEQTRDFTEVRDVVSATLRAMDCRVADGRPINVGAGRAISINRLAAIFGGPVARFEPRRGEPRHTLADTRLAAQLLGWHSSLSVEQAIAQLLQSERPP
jgi:nucleoside-diphosphate-sugar epimerase